MERRGVRWSKVGNGVRGIEWIGVMKWDCSEHRGSGEQWH
jgi:hypothetical protein